MDHMVKKKGYYETERETRTKMAVKAVLQILLVSFILAVIKHNRPFVPYKLNCSFVFYPGSYLHNNRESLLNKPAADSLIKIAWRTKKDLLFQLHSVPKYIRS